jgi:hypothetical protein
MGESGDAQAIADQLVNVEGRAPYTMFEAQRVKENFLALLRQLEYDKESGAVVSITDVQKAVAVEYGTVRSRLMSIAAEAAPKLASLRTAAEAQAYLEEVIAEVLENLTLDVVNDPTGRETVRAIRERIGAPH